MNGYKTWVGLIITVLGMLGLGDLVNNEQLTTLINAILQIVGIVIAVYGNYKAHQKIAELES